MKVFHIIDSGGLYGAEVMLLNLVEEQLDLGLEPVICSIGEPGSKEKEIEHQARARQLPLEIIRMLPGPNIFGAIRLLRRAKQIDAQIIHSHGYKGNILLGFVPSWLRSIPIISTLHGWTSVSGFSKMAAYEILDRLALHFVDAFVCVNASMLKRPELKRLKLKRSYVVDNGIPNNSFPETSRMEAMKLIPIDDAILFGKHFIIGTIGRLSKEKAYDNLIAALGFVVKTGIDAHLVVIGEGDQRNALTNLTSQMGLLDRVHLIGYRQNASRYLPLFDVYAISSLTEGLPITLLEAMRAQTPVVATRVGGIPNVLENGNAGVLVDPAEPRKLADSIVKIKNDNAFRKVLVKKSYERFVNYYSSRKMAEGYLKIYQQLCLG